MPVDYITLVAFHVIVCYAFVNYSSRLPQLAELSHQSAANAPKSAEM